MKVKKSIAAVFTGLALSAGIVLSGAPAANAINRVGCDNNAYLWLFSGNTTCWANAGTTNVYLADVFQLSAGNNAGYIATSAGTKYFGKNAWLKFANTNVSQIAIY